MLLTVARNIGEQIKYVRLDHPGPRTLRTNQPPCIRPAVQGPGDPQDCHVRSVRAPARASANDRRFKAALLDIGLLQNLCRVPVELELQERDLLAMYRGALAAQFVAQEMIAASGHELYYWARDARGSSAEVDYLAIREGRILPVEVKSGAGGSLRSLHLMLATYPNCPEGMVLYSGTYARVPEQRLTFLPLYYAAQVGDPRPDAA